MERKIGEIFKYNGECYQAIDNKGGIMCSGCVFVNEYNECDANEKVVGYCGCKNGNKLIFKKLEKVGEPFDFLGIYAQIFKTYCKPTNDDFSTIEDGKKILLPIKPNQEDMEENHSTENYPNVKETATRIANEIGESVKNQLERNMNKLNMKPFDLEAAKAGKPVCTRDGRKARIICFDRQHESNIVALIPEENEEYVCTYNSDGSFRKGTTHENDLMMLPEKKEGWVNVYKMSDGQIIIGQYPYESEDYCRNVGRSEDGYIDTIKIEWYE